MLHRWSSLSAATILGAITACASDPPPAVHAADVERMQCGGAIAPDQADVLASIPILGVEPVYSHIFDAAHAIEKQVIGAKLIVRPPPGQSADQLSRLLQCQGARVLLGRVGGAATSEAPYWLPDAWVNVDVVPDNGNDDILLTSDTVTDNLRLLARARQYAHEHAVAAALPLP